MRVNRRDVDQKVDRIIKTHFSTWSRQDTDTTMRGGECLRSALHGVVSGLEPKGRVSLKTISELQGRFAPSGSTAASLRVADGNEEIDRNFLTALTMATHSNPAKRKRTQLQAYLQSDQHELNQRELVALCRSLDGVNVVTNEHLRSHVLVVMEYVQHHGFLHRYPDEMRVMKSLFDEALTACYTHMKKERLDVNLFWQRYSRLVPLIGRLEDFQVIIDETRSWMHVKVELDRCCKSSRLARAMFGGASEMLSIENFSVAVKKEVALMNKQAVTEERLRAFKELVRP